MKRIAFLFCLISLSLSSQNLSFSLFQKYVSEAPSFGIELEPNTQLSRSIPIGDLNLDGVPDIMIAAHNAGTNTEGTAYILFLNVDGSVKSHQEVKPGVGGFNTTLKNKARYGVTIDTIGDINKDGIVDIAVGAYQDSDLKPASGAIYILFMKRDGTVASHQKLSDNSGGVSWLVGNDKFGFKTAPAGDLDGDGVLDIYTTVRDDAEAGPYMGSVFILYLNIDGTVKSQGIIAPNGPHFVGAKAKSFFGAGLANIGDLDNNGIEDLAIGTTVDQMWIVLLNIDRTIKSTVLIDETHPVIGEIIKPGYRFGVSVAKGVDINYDGIAEIIVTADMGSTGNLGESYIVYLNASGDITAYETISNLTVPNLNLLAGSKFGGYASFIGDIDGNGYPEIGVGDALNSEVVESGGAIYMISLQPKGCMGDECVWPGDANNDGVANAKDLFNIGLSYNATDLSKRRILPTEFWVGQYGANWQAEMHSANLKFADANGDGMIDTSDIEAIKSNYGEVQLKTNFVEIDPDGPPLKFVANRDSVEQGDSVEFDIYLGDAQKEAENVYGVSMSLRHSVTEANGSTNTVRFNSSWLGTDGVDMLTFQQSFEDGIDFSMVRNDYQNRTGQGFLANVNIVMPDDLGEMASGKVLTLKVTDLLIISYEEDTIKPDLILDSVTVVMNYTVGLNEVGPVFKSYPNPAGHYVVIESSNNIDGVELCDMYGNVLTRISVATSKVRISTSNFSNGYYTLRVRAGRFVSTQKITVIR